MSSKTPFVHPVPISSLPPPRHSTLAVALLSVGGVINLALPLLAVLAVMFLAAVFAAALR